MNPSILLLFFIAIPILEISLFIGVGSAIGTVATLLLVIVTAVVGVTLLRQQGQGTLLNARAALEAGEVPAQQLLEGVILLICGVLLLTPGFFTDLLGFAGLIPSIRRGVIRRFVSHQIGTHGVKAGTTSGPGGVVIEGEFHEKRTQRELKK